MFQTCHHVMPSGHWEFGISLTLNDLYRIAFVLPVKSNCAFVQLNWFNERLLANVLTDGGT